jgi:cytochrome P450
MELCASKYGSLFTLRLYPYDHMLVATDPRDIQTIFTRCPERFVERVATGLVLKPVLGATSIFLTTGAMHRRQRRLLKLPLRGHLAAHWDEEMRTLATEVLSSLPSGQPIGMRQPMRDITLRLIMRQVLGVDSPKQMAALLDEARHGVDPRLALLFWIPTLWYRNGRLNPARPLRQHTERIHRLFHEQIIVNRADPHLDERDDVLSLMMRSRDENGETLSDAELHHQLMTILGAGHESTAVALAWAVERISRNPSVKERLVAELEEGRETYLDAVVKETLRMRPPVLDAIRTATEEIELGGYRIPPGTLVSVGFTVSHRSPELWDDPLAFRPERFLEGRPTPYAYTPFGGGNRRCPGASLGEHEMRVVLTELLRQYDVTAAPGPEETMKLLALTLVPSRDAQVVLARRASAPAGATGTRADAPLTHVSSG